jgi:hypothetical protein
MDMPKRLERQTDMCNAYFRLFPVPFTTGTQPSPWHAIAKVQPARKLGLTLRNVGDHSSALT